MQRICNAEKYKSVVYFEWFAVLFVFSFRKNCQTHLKNFRNSRPNFNRPKIFFQATNICFLLWRFSKFLLTYPFSAIFCRFSLDLTCFGKAACAAKSRHSSGRSGQPSLIDIVFVHFGERFGPAYPRQWPLTVRLFFGFCFGLLLGGLLEIYFMNLQDCVVF